MKRIAMFLAIAAMCVGIGRAQDKTRTFHGDIMDSNCAAKGAHGMPDSKACTLACVKGGAKFVLYNSTTKKTYQLDDQTKPADFAGAKVDVTGTYDAATMTIHVTDIKAAS
jgi:hypothetical protein